MGTYCVGLNKTFDKLGDDGLPKSVINALISEDPELDWINPTDAIATEGPPSLQRPISWKGTPRFSYGALWLECEDPDAACVRKLLHMAAVFNGYVFNDAGERVELRKGIFGGEKVVTVSD